MSEVALPPIALVPQAPVSAAQASALPWTRFLLDVALGASLMAALHLFVLQISIVKGHSMEPSLHDGDRLVVDRIAANFGDVHRGDVVVLRYPRNIAIDFVKRIVAIPGDRVAMRAGQLYVNGDEVDPEWTCIQDRQDMDELEVPAGAFFVLGDNSAVLERHVPSAKRHHVRAHPAMSFIQCGLA